MTNLGSIFKSRDIILPTKVCLVKAMVFPVVMYGCESWTGKKAKDLTWGGGRDGALMVKRGGSRGRDTKERQRNLSSQRGQLLLGYQGG